MKQHFDIARCTASGKGFIAGDEYAIVGGNNGLHVFRTDENGDPVELIIFGCGDSDFDDEGHQIGGIEYLAPSDNDVPVFNYRRWGTFSDNISKLNKESIKEAIDQKQYDILRWL